MDIETAEALAAGLDDAVWTLHSAGVYDGAGLSAVIARRDEAMQALIENAQMSTASA